MSYSDNPLGQGTHLDRNSFMNNSQLYPEPSTEDPALNSPPRLGTIPVSYAYGAPTSPNKTSPKRVPSPTRSTSSSVRNRSARAATSNAIVNEEDIESNISYASTSTHGGQEPGAVRYARLKQRNQALGTSTYHPSGPGIILSPPNGASLRDTSVNVATAFHQAAGHNMPSTGRPHEYEKETHNTSTTNRRIAAPPSKVRKPISSSSTRLVPGDDVADRKIRAKSPILETMVSAGQAIARAVSPTRYFLRENDLNEDGHFQSFRMDDPPTKPLSRQDIKASTVPTNDSYDYEAEENYMRTEGSMSSGANRSSGHQKRKSTTMSTAARLSMDNKAYKPPSDDEEEEEDYEEDGTRRRKKSKKKDEGKALTTLPTIGYDKRKKKKSISRKNGAPLDEDEGISGGEQVSHPADDRRAGSRPPSRPPSRSGSVSRDSVPPSHPAHYQPAEPSLEEVPETEEEQASHDPDLSLDPDARRLPPRAQSKERKPVSKAQSERGRIAQLRAAQTDNSVHHLESQTHHHEASRFSIGGFLGKVVHFLMISVLRRLIQLIVMIFFLFWTVIGGIFTAIVVTPLIWIKNASRSARRDLPLGNILQMIVFGTIVALAAATLRPSSTISPSLGNLLLEWIPRRGSFRYHAPDIPAESVQDVIARLTQVENALADYAFKEQQAQKIHNSEKRRHNEVANRVELLHGRIESEAQRALEAEEQFRAAAAKGLSAIRSEFEHLQSEWERARAEDGTGNAVMEDLRQLRDRVDSIEGGVKEALELGRTVSKSGPSAAWWNKWSGNQVAIKSSDGQDVTGLIGSLVDHAISRLAKDGLGKADFALYSAGGRIIPHMTTNTYEVPPNSWIGSIFGKGYIIGRPPVTAIHPDINVGNCWPFAGSQGQIGVVLARQVFISEISIDHAPREIAHDVRGAPRQMEVWGLVEGLDNLAKAREYQRGMRERREEVLRRATEEGVPPPPEEDPYPTSLPRSQHYIRLIQFSYDIHAPQHVQTFDIPKEIQDIGVDFGVVVLMIKNNWGEDDFTCLYRLRVHGTEKDRRPHLLPEQDAS